MRVIQQQKWITMHRYRKRKLKKENRERDLFGVLLITGITVFCIAYFGVKFFLSFLNSLTE